MSPMFSSIKRFYDKGIYTKANVKTFVEAKKITAEEYKIITGDDYVI